MTKLDYGFHKGIAFADYQAIPAMNYSTLKFMARSPKHFQHNRENPRQPTAAMAIGSAAHSAILEPLMGSFAIWPGPGRRFGHEWDAFCKENAGKIMLNTKERDYVAGMMAAVLSNPLAYRYLRHGRSELTMIWRDLAVKRDFKARIDREAFIDGEPVLVSLKSTRDCRDFRFGPDAFKLGYYVQDALYQNGYFYLTGTLPRMVMIAIDNRPPFDSAVYRVPNDVLRQGQADLGMWLQRLAECEKSGKWPGVAEEELDLALPSYAYPSGDFDLDDLELVAR